MYTGAINEDDRFILALEGAQKEQNGKTS
jgi:hypothetical protein